MVSREGDPVTDICPAVGTQRVSVCLPVTVTPFARVGNIEFSCCGNAVVMPGVRQCPGIENGTCSFTITQVMCVKVPVDFGAETDVGEAFVNCMEASAEDMCRDCTPQHVSQ